MTFQSGPGDVFIGSGAAPFTTAGNTFDFNLAMALNVIVDPQTNRIAETLISARESLTGMVQTVFARHNMIPSNESPEAALDQTACMTHGGYTPNGNCSTPSGADQYFRRRHHPEHGRISLPAPPRRQHCRRAKRHSTHGSITISSQGYAYVDFPFEQQGTTMTL